MRTTKPLAPSSSYSLTVGGYRPFRSAGVLSCSIQYTLLLNSDYTRVEAVCRLRIPPIAQSLPGDRPGHMELLAILPHRELDPTEVLKNS